MKTFTADDIRREHEAALAALTDAQRQSLWRQRHARQMMNFNGLSEGQNLQVLFEREADERNADAAALATMERAPHANDNAAPIASSPANAGGAGG